MTDRFSKLLERIEVAAFPQPEYIHLQYPVILCHGYGSIASVFKPTPLNDTCMLYRRHGIAAFAPNVVPYASIEDRAHDWIRHISTILELTGAKQVNVIAHSMGGLDLRYAISKLGLGSCVKSLTTVATPHRGTCLAELGLSTPTILRDMLSGVFNWLGTNMYPSMNSDVIAALNDLTRIHISESFNPTVLDFKGTHYFSWSAAVGKGTEESINSVLIPLNRYIFEKEGINDGFISNVSAIWGDHLGQINLSHTEQIHLNLTRAHRELWERFWLNVVHVLRDAGY